jgi:Putative auto-transporter adhesin, head GIN domain
MRFATLLTLLVFAFSGAAATDVPVGAFRSIELSNGGHVTVRHGAAQRVTLVKGDLQHTRIRVDGSQRLTIDTASKGRPRGYRVEVEVVTPHLAAVSVSNGGRVLTAGAFPAQTSIAAAVEQGGTIDIRAIAADRVDASVYSGGGIYTIAQETLSAAVASGGVVKYWGEVKDVQKSVRDGGVVMRGAAADEQKPLSEQGPGALAPIPPVPPNSR